MDLPSTPRAVPELLVTNANGPLISIILPVFNAGPYLRECIDSVLAQSWSNWELILVDNGSDDDTATLAASYTDPRIRILHEPRRGVSIARNRALAVMRGAFFCFLDADDHLPKDALRLRADLFLRFPQAHFADGAMRAFEDRTGRTIRVNAPSFQGAPFDALMRLDESCFSGNTWMVRVVPGYAYRFPEHMNQSEDLAFYLSIAHQGIYVSTPREVLHYRVGHPSATSDHRNAHKGFALLYDWMVKLRPAPTPQQLKHAWRRLRRYIVRDHLRHGRAIAAIRARLMPPPSP